MQTFSVAIIGRPNVGKSTFFNRLLGLQKAIVDNISGVTRDRQYGVCEWNGKWFNVIDTGGFVFNSDDVFEKEIVKQALTAISEANGIIFMVDAADGIAMIDYDIAKILYQSSKPVWLVVNKVDNHQRLLEAQEFYTFKFDKIFFVSSVNGSGTGDLLDDIASYINIQQFDADDPNEKEYQQQNAMPKIAIIGQPNVGKSSLLNVLIGEERSIVSNIAGTTRDSVSTLYNLYNKQCLLIDTAGIRRKAKVHEDLEFYSVIRAIKAIDESNVVMLMIDAQQEMTQQDLSLFSMAQQKGKGIVILVNKWDLIKNKETNTLKTFEEKIKHKIAPFNDVPIVFISVKDKMRIHKALELAIQVFDKFNYTISTSTLNKWLKEMMASQAPPAYRGHLIKINYMTKLPTFIPSFALFCNFPEGVKTPYKNYIENQIRQKHDFKGVPIRIFFRKK